MKMKRLGRTLGIRRDGGREREKKTNEKEEIWTKENEEEAFGMRFRNKKRE